MSQFSIDAFRSALSNGLARNNLFLVQGTFPGGSQNALSGAAAAAGGLLGAASANFGNAAINLLGQGNPSSQIPFLCKAAKVPSATLAINNAFYMGRAFKYPGDKSYADWTITIYNDGSYSLRKAFEAWSNLINTNRTNVGPNAMNQFMTEWTVTPLTREGNPISRYKLVGCWPSLMGDITLDMNASTEPSTFDVTIAYQYFEVEGVTT